MVCHPWLSGLMVSSCFLLVELFYMKTCHFRGARPLSSPHHGLFSIDEPKIRYGMVPCRARTCHFCFPSSSIARIRVQKEEKTEAVVQFSPTQKHRFVSGYEAILNCPTVRFSLIHNRFIILIFIT